MTSDGAAGGDHAVYLYCFARPGAARGLALCGVDGHSAVTEVDLRKTAAVISRVALSDFRADDAARTQDPEWVIPRACRHERVVEAVMARSPVLPVRFGAVFSSGRALEDLLWQKEDQIARFFDAVSDKEEWAVKGFLDLDKAAAWAMKSDPALAGQAQRLASSPGARYFQEKRLRAAAQQQAKGWSRAAAARIQQRLRAEAAEVCPLRPRAADRQAKRAEMVFHCGFLVARDRVGDLLACVGRLGGQHAEQGLRLEVSGPWPPYNFCPTLWQTAQ